MSEKLPEWAVDAAEMICRRAQSQPHDLKDPEQVARIIAYHAPDTEALEAWHEWCHKAIDAGYVESMPGNEIPWGMAETPSEPAGDAQDPDAL